MPVTRRAAKQAKPKLQEKTETLSDATDTPTTVTQEDNVAPHSVFETFETATALTPGLWIVREVNVGKYELVNLSTVEATVLGSPEIGRLIRADASGGRLNAISESEKVLKGAELKVGQALGSANRRIFRFLKLPIELRFKVYDLTVCSDKTLCVGSYQYCPDEILAGIQLTATCRQIYEETRSMFWRNHFRIRDIFDKQAKLLAPVLTENLRKVTWSWWANKIKDPNTLKTFMQCKNLKIFNLRLTKYAVFSASHGYTSSKRQFLYQDEPAVAKFKLTNGFDELVSLRGLERVTVKNDYPSDEVKIRPEDLSDQELKAFETFLTQMLTQPKQPNEPPAKKAKRTTNTGNKKASVAI
ncbi:uncharacterized protein PAC_01108 [Phialocephala subalpina]|uniref:Uncharacterized protein n=1 Tax=Phialocephala subalpina TaxID=576137 RepID=A0A1L7WEL5_9HELO|nr:uncharacterized protein PAC_01108 [Phialocephala subalpina]